MKYWNIQRYREYRKHHKSVEKKGLLQRNVMTEDVIVTSTKGIANTFAKFCSNLYAEEKHDEDEGIDEEETTHSHKELDMSEDQAKRSNENTSRSRRG